MRRPKDAGVATEIATVSFTLRIEGQALDRVSQGLPEPCEYNKLALLMQGLDGLLRSRRPRRPLNLNLRSCQLTLQVFPDVLNRLADLTPRATESFLEVAGCLIRGPFVMKPLVVREITDRFLGLSFELFSFAVEFVPIHGVTSTKFSSRTGASTV